MDSLLPGKAEAEYQSGPDAFPLYFRVKRERRVRGRREPEVDRVPEVVVRES